MKNAMKVSRVQMDLTQEQLAEKVGITRQTVSLIEKGKYNPSLKLCLSICDVLHKSLDELFWLDKEERQ